MPTVRILSTGGVNLYINPLVKNEGELLYSENVDSYPYGAKTKRTGYSTFLGTADGSAVTSLFSWTKDDGSLFLYRSSGSSLYYSIAGTGAWTLAGNGTIGAGSAVKHAVLANTLFICDGVGSTRYTTSGTSFVDGTLAPVATSLEMYQNRIYAAGTASTLFYSSANDGTNWSTSGTSDSSSFTVPGEGRLKSIMKVSDRLIASKTSGQMYKWDGFSLIDMASDLGPTSDQSIGETEGYKFWFNRLGLMGFGGAKPELLSNAVQPYIYNNMGSGIAGSTFDTMPATVHRYDYLASIGTVTEDLLDYTVRDAVLKYNYQKNEFLFWRFHNKPTALCSYKDTAGVQQLIFGDSSGQVYKKANVFTDNGNPITSSMIYLVTFGSPETDKEFSWIDLFFNPGCQAKIQVAISDTFTKDSLKWQDLGNAESGHIDYKFPSGSRGRLLFVRIYESSLSAPYSFYGMTVEADFIEE